jgi:hypothetical protein
VHHRCQRHPGGKWKKASIRKVFIISFGHLWLVALANLPPVSTSTAELVAKFAAGVVDTSGKFAAVSLIPTAILLPVLLTPVVHLDLRISLRIFEKI